MHAFLIIGGSLDQQEAHISQIKGERIEQYLLITEKSHTLEAIRSLQKQLSLAPQNPEKGRVVIIQDAHLLTTEAANAFLKTLEEPSGNTLFILTTDNEETVLETIRSRTQIVFLPTTFEKIDIKKAKDTFNTLCIATLGEKFTLIDKITERQEALTFCKEQIAYIRELIKENNDTKFFDLLDKIQKIYIYILANVNIKIALSELVLHYPQKSTK